MFGSIIPLTLLISPSSANLTYTNTNFTNQATNITIQNYAVVQNTAICKNDRFFADDFVFGTVPISFSFCSSVKATAAFTILAIILATLALFLRFRIGKSKHGAKAYLASAMSSTIAFAVITGEFNNSPDFSALLSQYGTVGCATCCLYGQVGGGCSFTGMGSSSVLIFAAWSVTLYSYFTPFKAL